MVRIIAKLRSLLRALAAPLTRLLTVLWATEPVRVLTFAVAVVVFLAAKVGIVLDPQEVQDALVIVIPILLGGELARRQVSPAAGDVGPHSDALLDNARP